MQTPPTPPHPPSFLTFFLMPFYIEALCVQDMFWNIYYAKYIKHTVTCVLSLISADHPYPAVPVAVFRYVQVQVLSGHIFAGKVEPPVKDHRGDQNAIGLGDHPIWDTFFSSSFFSKLFWFIFPCRWVVEPLTKDQWPWWETSPLRTPLKNILVYQGSELALEMHNSEHKYNKDMSRLQ